MRAVGIRQMDAAIPTSSLLIEPRNFRPNLDEAVEKAQRRHAGLDPASIFSVQSEIRRKNVLTFYFNCWVFEVFWEVFFHLTRTLMGDPMLRPDATTGSQA